MKPVLLSDYHYDLPDERIAQFPLKNRDEAKMLYFKNKQIEHAIFNKIPELLPKNSLLVFNDTKVIPARIYFEKSSGAVIEVFLLTPEAPSKILPVMMQETTSCIWKCMIGNKKRWKAAIEKQIQLKHSPEKQNITLTAELIDIENNFVRFSWNKSVPFVDILEILGELPLPPYIRRKADTQDDSRYQTVYSENKGAVAAPTAGLHFTENVLQELKKQGIEKAFLTLHVSAGTFQPVKVENILEHTMHQEQIVVSKATLEKIQQASQNKQPIIAVGTTSMRTLESLYWLGVKLQEKHTDKGFLEHFDWKIEKLFPYQLEKQILPSLYESLKAILLAMETLQLENLIGKTEIFIFPGYKFRVCAGIVTNFHLPETTLMLLIAAFVGDFWKEIYASALANNYRFLSYGDSSLLLNEAMP